ncbi:MAG: NPXTG-anchored protein [Clostridiales bacterium]|jgi:LPXTG-motif cell wall-anchored protein|nr:NPXTG-anchored protein [Clostridiales bacterium]
MKRFLALALCIAMVLSLNLVNVMALEEGDTIDVTVHYKNEHGALPTALVTVQNARVYKDLGDGLINTEYGWSQFDGPFEEDDFGVVFKFQLGYVETDIAEIGFRSEDWVELSHVAVPEEKILENTFEIWVTATGTDMTAYEIEYSAPGAADAAPADDAAPAAEAEVTSAAAPAEENPATGDNSAIAVALIALALSAGTAVVIKKKLSA